MKRVLIRVSAFQKGIGAAVLKKVLRETIERTLAARISKEIASCVKNKSEHSHWLRHVLPDRIVAHLAHPDCLLSEHSDELYNQLRVSFCEDEVERERILFFGIVERRLCLKRLKGYGGEDVMEMIFFEHSKESPDKRLQEILREVLKKEGY